MERRCIGGMKVLLQFIQGICSFMYFDVKGWRDPGITHLWVSLKMVLLLFWLEQFLEGDPVKKLKPLTYKLLSFLHQESLTPLPTLLGTVLTCHSFISIPLCYIHFKFCFLAPSLVSNDVHSRTDNRNVFSCANSLALAYPIIYDALHHPLCRAHVCTLTQIFTAILTFDFLLGVVYFFSEITCNLFQSFMSDKRHVRHDNKYQSYMLTENLRIWTKGQEI